MPDSGRTPRLSCPPAVVELIERFDMHRETYRQASYNETQVRREFIDPMFKALGWDIDNEQGHAEAYKDVVHEDAIKVGGSTKAPDYCFRVGGVRKFFVEAKKPAEDIKQKQEHAYQLRRYAWTAKLPVSILTDFEEFAVYDCTKRPKPTDKAATGRVLYATFDEYAQRWGEIASVFSKDAILKGSFDKYAESAKRKRGTAEVDTEFLKEIEQWRDLLAHNIALRNPSLTVRELNYAVSKTIDRIIFLRMCEDRGVETYAQLRILPNGPKIYPRLVELFRRADERYNSGLFHFEHEKDRAEAPDTLTPGLTIDDKVLKDIIKRLYYPECPYEFSVMPPEILGQVYEQFLGKVITLTAGHRARIEFKPEVRKAGGVYYTPKYIVEHTVGKLLEGKTPADIGPMLDQRKQSRKRKRPVPTLCILDPACGSGSFLLGAYQYLLDWYLRWYADNDPQAWTRKKNPPIYQSPKPDPTAGGATWRLTVAERKRILLNHIYGVDIDAQAVEVTKLSLLLKVLEGESHQTLDNQLRLFHERALPDLAANIKCGNSLIGPDFYDGKQLDLLDEEERYRINVFDWEAEFPQVFQSPERQRAGSTPGFDAVIGNPPYVRMETFKSIKDYLRTHYASHEERTDLYAYFIERGLHVLRNSGLFGMIVSNKFIRAKYGRPLRSFVMDNCEVLSVADFAGAPVFQGATVRTVVLILRRSSSPSQGEASYLPVPPTDLVRSMGAGTLSIIEYARDRQELLGRRAFGEHEWILIPKRHAAVIAAIRHKSLPLSEATGKKALFGLKTGYNEAFIIDGGTRERLIREDARSSAVIRPVLFGKDVRRYEVRFAHRYVIYCHPEKSVEEYPPVRDHLRAFRARLKARAGDQQWYELQQPAVALLEHLSRPRIVYPIIAPECRFTLDTSDRCINDKCFILPIDDLGILALLNSALANFYFDCICAALEGAGDRYLEFRAQYVDRFPVARGLPTSPIHGRLEEGAQRMLDLHKQLGTAKTPTDKTAIQRQIDATDRRIDQLVYELYGLTDDEIRIVEEAVR